MKKNIGQRGMTLVEMLVVLVISAVGIVLFYTVFITNWQAYQTHLTRSNLWEEADTIMEMVSTSVRDMRQIDVESGDEQQTATLTDPDGNIFASFLMTRAGEFQIVSAGNNTSTLTKNLDYPRSSFVKQGKALLVNLALTDQVFRQQVKIQTAAEIFPRN